MKKTAVIALVFVTGFLFTGCMRYRYGDARLQKNPDFFAVNRDHFYLKPVPVGASGKQVLQVREAPFPIYPTHVRIALTPEEAERKQDQPWTTTRLRIEFRELDGKVFYSNEVSLASAERGRASSTFHQVDAKFRPTELRPWRASQSLPHHVNYDVVVTVLEPSRNPKHKAVLYADTYVR